MLWSSLDEFEKEFKKLCLKFHSLEADFDVFKKDLELNPTSHILISWLWEEIEWSFFKVKKFVCKSISRNSVKSGIRIIYKYSKEKSEIEFSIIEFVEIYHKNIKENHDIERIKKYYKNK